MKKFLFFFLIDLKGAIDEFKQKPFYSLFSTFGIMIALISLIVMICVGQSMKKESLKRVEKEGKNLIIIKGLKNSKKLKEENFKTIKNIVKNSGLISRVIRIKDSIYLKGEKLKIDLIKSDETFVKIKRLRVIKGRTLLKSDVEKSKRVLLISSDIYKRFSINVGDSLVVGNKAFLVIGVLEEVENVAIIPFCFRSGLEIDSVLISLFSSKNIISFSKSLEGRGFEIVVPYKMLEKENETIKVFNVVLGSVAFMSLLSGGVSVMNVVLLNIAEQTRQIGLKLAIGATRGRIVQFYLIYTTLLTLSASLFAWFVSLIILFLISYVLKIEIEFFLSPFLVGLAISFFSGVLFGIYPALKAGSMDPVKALKESTINKPN